MPLRFPAAAPEAYHFPLTIGHLLDSAMLSAADQEIIYRDKHRYTYRGFHERIGRLASLLSGLGAEEGSTVAMLDWDSHRYLEAYFAVPMMGAVLMTANVRLPSEQLCYTLNHSGAEILIVHRDFFPLVETVLPQFPAVKAVVAIMDGAEGPLPTWATGEYEALSAAASADFPFRDFDENALATTFYTTGTTGNPKGVCFTHRQLVLHALVARAPFGVSALSPSFGAESVYMPLTPMFHVHAWGMPYVATMLGLKQVYPGPYEPEMICRLRAEHGVTYSHCVPTILKMILDAADRTGADLEGWTMTIGGAALTQALCAEGRRRGMNLVAGYGMSETAPIIAIARRRRDDDGQEAAIVEAFCTSGIAVPLVSARIVDEDMNVLPADGTTRGELVLRAPWLTPCYVGDDRASATLWHGGWMHTQDIATLDERGNIMIRDRLKDVIKTGGEWIDSIMLEELICTVEGIAEAAVIALPDLQWGERPMAVVVPQPGFTPTLHAINAPILAAIQRGEVTRYAKIGHFATLDALPKTSVGKIDKKLLRTQFPQGSAQ